MTTYAPPSRFSHGDFPTKANLDTINDALDAIGEILSDGTTPQNGEELPRYNPGVFFNREKWTAGGVNRDGSDYWILHKARYLHYVSTGSIVDTAGLETAVSLSNDASFNVYDLDSVSWLAYGMMYKVTGVDFCMESTDP